MSKELERTAKFIDEFCKNEKIGFDDFVQRLSDLVEEDRKKQTHPTVISLLEAAREELSSASFNIYASYK